MVRAMLKSLSEMTRERIGKECRFNLVLCAISLVSSAVAQVQLSVLDYGAVGDAVQCRVNTVSNSVTITSTNTFAAGDIGKRIQIFDAGAVTTAPECQDLLATITNVSGGSALIDFVPQRTLTNTFCAYGTDNRTAFQNAVDAASGSNTTINVPAGSYMILPIYQSVLWGNAGVRLHKGALRFMGAGTNNTFVVSQGAWLRNTNLSNLAWRGFLFAIVPPVTNDFPIVFQDLTLDGGVPDGLTSNYNFPASNVTGDGWDETHGAIVIRGGGFQAPTVSQMTWSNVLFRHWRGEMVKSNDTSTNGNLNVFNCVFDDGNATAINIYAAQNISNCLFRQLFQVGEFYQAYATNLSYLQNCVATNISGNHWAFNGAKSNSAPYLVRSNVFHMTAGGRNGVMTTPGANISIQGNSFIGYVSGVYAIVLGASGYQGTWCNSNIVVAYNQFTNVNQVVQISGAGGAGGANRVEGVRVFSNVVTTTSGTLTPQLLTCNGWSRDVVFSDNQFIQTGATTDGTWRARVTSGAFGSTCATIELNNLYYSPVYDLTGTNNHLSYAGGSRYEIIYAAQPASKWALVTTNASQIPSGAQILIQNNNTSGTNAVVFLNSDMTQGPVIVPHGRAATFRWTNGGWQTVTKMSPPSDLRVIDSDP